MRRCSGRGITLIGATLLLAAASALALVQKATASSFADALSGAPGRAGASDGGNAGSARTVVGAPLLGPGSPASRVGSGCGPAGGEATDPPTYYAVDLVPTGRVPGTRGATGTGHVTFARSPFGVSISPVGTYVYDVDIRIEKLRPRRQGVYVVWISTSDLSQIKRLGILDEGMQIRGTVNWNKFLIVVSLEPTVEQLGDSWEGPIVLRGMSRSGRMHTMAGHGPFEAEPCAKYGFQ